MRESTYGCEFLENCCLKWMHEYVFLLLFFIIYFAYFNNDFIVTHSHLFFALHIIRILWRWLSTPSIDEPMTDSTSREWVQFLL